MAEDDDDDDDDWEEGALGMEECLFCSHVSASLEKNIKHMSMSHSFFLPDTEYLSDLEGLISYLGKTKPLCLEKSPLPDGAWLREVTARSLRNMQ